MSQKNHSSNESEETFDFLNDRIEEQEKTKETLKSGLLSFLDYVEKVENEKLHRKG